MGNCGSGCMPVTNNVFGLVTFALYNGLLNIHSKKLMQIPYLLTPAI